MWRTGVATGSVVDGSNGLNYLANPQYQFGDMWSIKYDAMNIGLPGVIVQPEPTTSDQAAVDSVAHKAEPAVENAAARVETAIQKAAEKAAEKAASPLPARSSVASSTRSREDGPRRELRPIALSARPRSKVSVTTGTGTGTKMPLIASLMAEGGHHAAPTADRSKSLRDYLEMMSRAIFSAGLSWRVIEAKWPGTVKAFDAFDPETVAAYSPNDIERLMVDPGVVHNRKKIEAIVANAGELIVVDRDFGGFAKYLDSFKRARMWFPTSTSDSSSWASSPGGTSYSP